MAFLDEDFLLESSLAKKLYHEVVENLPIIDYHCHLSAKEVYENKPFKSITDVWLNGDHYKWRFLRSFGVSENLISGGSSDYDRFLTYAKYMPYAIGNPLYHWSHLELRRFFKTDLLLNEKNAKNLFELTNAKIKSMKPSDLLDFFKVEIIGTTDDPTDDLKYHSLLKKENNTYRVIPSFRPDKAIHAEKDGFVEWISDLEKVVGFKIDGIKALEEALESRIEFFNQAGCKSSDHSFDHIMYKEASIEEVEKAFAKAMKKEELSDDELRMYKGHILAFLGKTYKTYNWVQQYHIGAMRNVNFDKFEAYGADFGYDSMNDQGFIAQLGTLLNAQEKVQGLPKTVVYTLNPAFNEAIATLVGSFNEVGIKQKVQFGSGWWFNDQSDGMKRHLEAVSQMSILSNFIGMTTDSRSFLSYVRHEYFRRIVVNKLASLVTSGQYPEDFKTLSEIAIDICYQNAKNYFSL